MIKNNILLLLCLPVLLCYSACSAQKTSNNTTNKKATALYEQAIQRSEVGKWWDAIDLLNQSIQLEPAYLDALLALAGCYAKINQPENSIPYFEKSFEIDSVYTFGFKQNYALQLAKTGRFQKALDIVNQILQIQPPKNPTSLKTLTDRKKNYEFAVAYEKNNADKLYQFAPQNLGDGINSHESEYFPSLTIYGSELVFTRNINQSNEDFYSSINDSLHWGKALPLKGGINTIHNEGAQNISQDGNWLVFTGCNRPEGYGSCDIYISYKTPTGWTAPENLGPTVNSDQWDSQPCLSPDKQALYFTSRRFGGNGGSDIYVSYLQPNGKFGTPQNLGGLINSPDDEQCPFIHADNQTLYFTSPFWPGYGNQDIFYSRKNLAGNWQKPVNLGYPINTVDQEGTLFITTDGNKAYYASDRADSKGRLDIYSFDLREDMKPIKTTWIKGRVTDAKSLKGLQANVELIDIVSNQQINLIKTDADGNYLITLPFGKEYAFNVNKEGYLFYTDNFKPLSGDDNKPFEKNITLQPIEINASIVLSNIFFDVNKYDLNEKSKADLDKLVLFLTQNPTIKIRISGHTDNVGNDESNRLLSENRAKAVVNYLMQYKISRERLEYKGFGKSIPISSNDTEKGRATNRRTELTIIGK